MRTELEKIVGPAALDERPVRDLWPLAIMEERAGTAPPKVLVVRPTGRDQVTAVLRWAGENKVEVTPMGGASGVCGALSPAAGEIALDMSAFDRIFEIDETNLICRCGVFRLSVRGIARVASWPPAAGGPRRAATIGPRGPDLSVPLVHRDVAGAG